MDEMYEVIRQLLRTLEAQQENMRLLSKTLRIVLEEPNIDREKLLSLTVINTAGMVDDMERLIAAIRMLVAPVP